MSVSVSLSALRIRSRRSASHPELTFSGLSTVARREVTLLLFSRCRNRWVGYTCSHSEPLRPPDFPCLLAAVCSTFVHVRRGSSARPNHDPDPPGAGTDMPGRIGRVLGVLRKLIDYGRHFATVVQQR